MDLTGERVHELKTWPEFFTAIDAGDKTFEMRRDDRGGYQCGDYLILKEWHPRTGAYTGREMVVEVTWILRDPLFGVAPGYACMAIKRIDPDEGLPTAQDVRGILAVDR